MSLSDLPGRSIAIWGYEREGRSVEGYCTSRGIEVAVAQPDLESGPEPAVSYGRSGRRVRLGAEVVIKSPGFPVTSPIYLELVARGTAVTSLADL